MSLTTVADLTQVMDSPLGMDTSDSNGAVLELPAGATLGHLRRATTRSSGGAIPPNAQVSVCGAAWSCEPLYALLEGCVGDLRLIDL